MNIAWDCQTLYALGLMKTIKYVEQGVKSKSRRNFKRAVKFQGYQQAVWHLIRIHRKVIFCASRLILVKTLCNIYQLICHLMMAEELQYLVRVRNVLEYRGDVNQVSLL